VGNQPLADEIYPGDHGQIGSVLDSFGISNGWPQSDVGWFTGSIYFRVPED
jgi:hypothetical protein